jgi:DDE superfamily endonuclease
MHMSNRLVVPRNITNPPLPPKCPELNPVENVWQLLRDNWLSNRIFKSYNDILDHCYHAWNKLVDLPWKIMSIGLRDWAPVLVRETRYNSLSMAATRSRGVEPLDRVPRIGL